MFDLVVREVVYALFAGRMLLATLTLTIGGYMIGFGARSAGGRIGLLLVLLFVSAAMIFTSEHMISMEYGTPSGVYPRGFFDTFVVALFGILFALMLGAFWFGVNAATQADRQDIDAASTMTANDFVSEIDVIVAHPALSQSGWIVNRWYQMSAAERVAWAESNLRALQALRIENRDSDFSGHGMNLPVRLAEIDQSAHSG